MIIDVFGEKKARQKVSETFFIFMIYEMKDVGQRHRFPDNIILKASFFICPTFLSISYFKEERKKETQMLRKINSQVKYLFRIICDRLSLLWP